MRALSFAILAALCACSDETTEPALPCAVASVLRDVCQRCHGTPPALGVPISLVSYADTQAPYTEEPLYRDTPTWRVMADVLAQGLMPQAPVVLSDADRQTLLAWTDSGAPPAAEGTICR